ncbi:MAG: GatB/YqeY domain-containing protein [Coriobacteriia bacterium]
MDKAFLESEIVAAMRAQDKPRLSILRLVKNEIDVKERDSKSVATSEDVIGAVKKVLKQTGETLEGSIKAGTNQERTDLLGQQVVILESYLPNQVCGPELLEIIDRVLGDNAITSKRDMGRAIGLVVAETGGNCDKAEVAKIVGGRLS